MTSRPNHKVVGRFHELKTPEGVPLRFEIARPGDRASAFALDLLLVTAMIVVVAVLGKVASGGPILTALLLIVVFLLRNFYFVFFEIRWQGSTPGKRKFNLRVIDRHGSALRGDQIFVRNIMREIEFWLPLAALDAPDQIFSGVGGWSYLVISVWIVVFVFMPSFNSKRLRIGDMVAGTMVVIEPRLTLLADLSGRDLLQKEGRATFEFTPEQLAVYGIYELQVLENLLRRNDPQSWDTRQAVFETIQRKIDWFDSADSRQAVDVETFLRDFYAAQRGRLEHGLLLGKRKENKSS